MNTGWASPVEAAVWPGESSWWPGTDRRQGGEKCVGSREIQEAASTGLGGCTDVGRGPRKREETGPSPHWSWASGDVGVPWGAVHRTGVSWGEQEDGIRKPYLIIICNSSYDLSWHFLCTHCVPGAVPSSRE